MMDKVKFEDFVAKSNPNNVEFANFEHARKCASSYVMRELTDKIVANGFYIDVKVSTGENGNRFHFEPSEATNTVFLSENNDWLKNRLVVAYAIARIALIHIPRRKGTKEQDLLPREGLVYFSHKLLSCCIGKNNGSPLRANYTGSEDEILAQILTFFPNYNVATLEPDTKKSVDDIFNDVFHIESYQKNLLVGMLACDIRRIQLYISEHECKRPIQIRLKQGAGLAAMRMGDKSRGVGLSALQGKLYPPREPSGKYFDIYYPSLEDVRANIGESWKDYALMLLRYIIAHELSHLVLHYDASCNEYRPSFKPVDRDQEASAARGAILIMEHRELLYDKGNNSTDYRIACHKIRELAKHYHENKQWIIDVIDSLPACEV
jgi:hypothetical protein